jgi:hypothetical protein
MLLGTIEAWIKIRPQDIGDYDGSILPTRFCKSVCMSARRHHDTDLLEAATVYLKDEVGI